MAALSPVLLSTCSLQTSVPRVQLALRLPATAAHARGRGLKDRQCFAAFVTGEGSDVTASEFGTRTPTCFGAAGKYMGAFSSDDMVQGKAQISLALGRHKITLLALDKTEECAGKTLNYFFPDADTGVAAAYAVGSSAEVDVNAETSLISIASDRYEPPINLSPTCTRAEQGCLGAAFCDTFTGADGSLLSLHYPDIGPLPWNVSASPLNPVITNNRADITAQVGFTSLFLNTTPYSRSITTAKVMLGNYGLGGSDFQLLARYLNSQSYVSGRVSRALSSCTLNLYEFTLGIPSTLATGTAPCDGESLHTVRLQVNGSAIQFSFNATTIQSNFGSPMASGTRFGFSSDGSSSPITPVLVDSITVYEIAP